MVSFAVLFDILNKDHANHLHLHVRLVSAQLLRANGELLHNLNILWTWLGHLSIQSERVQLDQISTYAEEQNLVVHKDVIEQTLRIITKDTLALVDIESCEIERAQVLDVAFFGKVAKLQLEHTTLWVEGLPHVDDPLLLIRCLVCVYQASMYDRRVLATFRIKLILSLFLIEPSAQLVPIDFTRDAILGYAVDLVLIGVALLLLQVLLKLAQILVD